MLKKLIFIQIGLALFIVPLVSSAAVAGGAAIMPGPCYPFSHSLSVGSTGSDVVALQNYLAAQGDFYVSSTGCFGVLTRAAVGRWQAQNNIAASGTAGNGIFGPLSRAYFVRSCGGGSGGGAGGSSTTPTSDIQQLNAPGNVTLAQGGIAEIRNESTYFTLQSVSSSSATIQISPVGCWNAFPSDPPPKIVCMLALVPIPPQTFAIGQIYAGSNYTITLTQLSTSMATFTIAAK